VDTATSSFSPLPSLAPAQVNTRLGRADSPLVLDVRRRPKFAESARLIAGAQYCAPEDLADFIAAHEPREVLVYCVYGHNVSEDAVVALNAAGWTASQLAGGIEGGQEGEDDAKNISIWRSDPPLTIDKRVDWGVTGEQPSRWITRERPKIDRVACPWLIRRFVDQRAEFFYVPTAQVFEEAARRNAVAYDIPGAPVSHVGELCSFDALLQGFALSHPALDLLACIVRGADTDRLDLSPQSAGLLALSLGLSRLHASDDQAMLEAAMPMYDALFAWCCDKVQAQDERHSWQPAAMTGSAA